jgi:hypothetical protein
MTVVEADAHVRIAELRSRAQSCLARGEIESVVNLIAVVTSEVRKCGCGRCAARPKTATMATAAEGGLSCPR